MAGSGAVGPADAQTDTSIVKSAGAGGGSEAPLAADVERGAPKAADNVLPAEPVRQRRWQSDLPEVLRASASPAVSRPEAAAGPLAQAADDAVKPFGGVYSEGGADRVSQQASQSGSQPTIAGQAPNGLLADVSADLADAEILPNEAARARPALNGAAQSSGQGVAVNTSAENPTAELVSVVGGSRRPETGGLFDASRQAASARRGNAAPVRESVNAAPATNAGAAPVEGDVVSLVNPAGAGDNLVDPGELVPSNGAAKLAGSEASANASQPANTAGNDRQFAGLAAAVPAAAYSTAEFVDVDGEPDGELTLALNTRVVGQAGDVSAARMDASQTPTQAQSGQVATQVAAEIARNLRNGETRFQMRFDPPELGKVNVSMKVAPDGSVQAHLIVERPETLDMFMRDQRGLERALEAAGLNADSENLKFSLSDNGNQQSAFSQDDEAGGNGGPNRDGASDAEEQMIDPQELQMAYRAQNGGLDIRI